MILDKKVAITISNNKQYYLDKGYKDIKQGDTIYVKPDELPEKSHALEIRKCDFCKKNYEREHRAHLITFERFGEDVCPECAATEKYRKIALEKQKKTCLERYGVEWASQTDWFQAEVKQTSLEKYGVVNWNSLPEIQAKREQTCLDKYGYSSASQSPEVKEKTIQTNLDRYGVEWTMQNSSVHDKAVETNLQRYGYENPSQNEVVKEKREQTFLDRYGYANPGQIPEVKEKIAQAFYQNGTTKSSQQQVIVHEMIKELYPDLQVEFNYPVSHCNLDVALFYNQDIKIDIEYDGWYWHRDAAKDRARDEFLKTQGYKILRIRSAEMTPTKQELIDSIEDSLIKQNHSFHAIQLPDWDKRTK